MEEDNMVKVTVGKHCYYLDGYWKSNLDAMKKDLRKDYDCFPLLVSREGFGKSTLAFQSALYVDPTFNLDRVVFTADQFLDAVENAERYQAIVFDETMGYLSTRGSMSKFNRVLIKVMSEMRSKNLFVFLCIPNFFMMDWYVAQHRSTGLINIPKRGTIHSYDYKTKGKLYRMGKKHHSYCVPANFWGRCTKYFPLNKEAYEAKKQASIREWTEKSRREDKWLIQRDKLIKECINKRLMSRKEVFELLDLSIRQIERIVT